MDEIEEIKKNLQCQICQDSYSGDSIVCIYAVCQHHSCRSCYRSVPLMTCPICKCTTSDTSIPSFEYMLTVVKNQLEAPKEDHHKCAECEKSDSELDLQLCETCHELKFEDLEDVKKHALCEPCAIKKHMRKGHHTVDFYPYLSAYNFCSHSSNIDSKAEEYKSAQDLLNNTFTSFSTLSVHVLENYSVLTNMTRRSRNTKQQVEFFEKMEKFIDKSKSIHGDADSDMKNHTAKLEETLAEIKEWYEGRMKDCVDESEIIKLPNSEMSENNDTGVDA